MGLVTAAAFISGKNTHLHRFAESFFFALYLLLVGIIVYDVAISPIVQVFSSEIADVDECKIKSDDCSLYKNTRCRNVPGSFVCDCKPKFHKARDGSGGCEQGRKQFTL